MPGGSFRSLLGSENQGVDRTCARRQVDLVFDDRGDRDRLQLKGVSRQGDAHVVQQAVAAEDEAGRSRVGRLGQRAAPSAGGDVMVPPA